MLDMSELNRSQREAVKHTDGQLLIVAGAGTGKTKTLVYRVAYLIDKGIAPSSILLLTFTNKAAEEMQNRISNMIGEKEAKNVTACTFHSFCNIILRKYAKYIGFDNDFTIIGENDDADIISLMKAENNARYDIPNFPSARKLASIFSLTINKGIPLGKLLSEERFYNIAPFTEEIIELFKASMSYKHSKNMMNYDDLLIYTRELLKSNDEIRQLISKTYSYIMVDEYQDTNAIQFDILKAMRMECGNLAVVGDDMQSLYAFRGATVKNIIDFPNVFKNQKCEIIKLEENYRSTQEILDLSNHVCENATEGYKKTLVSANNIHGEMPTVVKTYSQKEEADYILNYIEEMHKNGSNYEDICVLIRNSLMSSLLEIQLKKQNIPFKKFGGGSFINSEHVQDVLAYMRVIKNNYDELAWFRILKNHRWIGNVNSRKISKECSVNGATVLLNKEYKKRKYGDELIDLYRMIGNAKNKSLVDLINYILNYYIDVYMKNLLAMRTDEDRRKDLITVFESYTIPSLKILPDLAEGYDSITDFMDDLSLEANKKKQKDDEDGVIISTIHSAKGLEFENVIIMDCIDTVFPSTLPSEKGTPEDNEELRCFYVAITRAKKSLQIMCPEYVKLYGRGIFGVLSHFMDNTEDYYNLISDGGDDNNSLDYNNGFSSSKRNGNVIDNIFDDFI